MDFRLPEIGEGIYDAELVRWLVKPGESVKHGQSLMEVLTDKATMEVPSPFVGTISQLRGEVGQKIKVGETVLSFDGKLLSEEAPHPAETATAATPAERAQNGPAGAPSLATMSGKAAPSVRHMARKLGIDLTRIRGTGPGGRVLIDDLTQAIQVDGAPAKVQAPRGPDLDVGVAGTKVKMLGLRRKIAEHMVESTRAIPHYTYIDEVDVTELVHLRSQVAQRTQQASVKLTYLAFFVKAAVRALIEVPIVNSKLNESAGEIEILDHYHIGIAVATRAGLIVPVIRDADRREVWDIAREVERVSEDARTGKLRREDLGGGTFTITSIGGIGGLISTPIINHPEVAILGVGNIIKRPVYDEHGNLRPADMIYISISFDHRVVDGAVGALFGNALAKQLKNPAALLMPEKV
jgi:pyruvate dehydrogenase E2 component (dihydrolipoamide acetyltransferase)/2-oxoisovalerate dehydrogenase E2 component (dihydrolipoyl transacylase)